MSEKISYFIDPEDAPDLFQTDCLETKILTGLNGEKMMKALASTAPG